MDPARAQGDEAPRLKAGGASLVEQDAKAYSKWAHRFIEVLRFAEVPARYEAEGAGEPEKLLAGLLGKARTGTIRVRVRAWEALARWLAFRRGYTWPQKPRDLVEFVWVG